MTPTKFIPECFYDLEKKFILSLYPNGVKVGGDVPQHGGSVKVLEYPVVDVGGLHIFKVEFDHKADGDIYISVIPFTQQPTMLVCSTVIVDKSRSTASLHGLTYANNCAREGLRRPGGGSILLKFVLNLLVMNKQRFNIKRVTLMDNSYFECEGCDNPPKLARLRMITDGNTWYGKYGFKPYDQSSGKPSANLLQQLKINQKEVLKLKTADVGMLHICKKIIETEKITTVSLSDLKNKIGKYEMLRDFIVVLSKSSATYCCLLGHILEELYVPKIVKRKPLLFDFYGKSFYLDF